VRGGGRAPAAAVTAEVGADDREALGQEGRHAPPHQVSLWEAVQQQDRGSGTGSTREDAGLSGLNLGRLETLQHPGRHPKMRRRPASRGGWRLAIAYRMPFIRRRRVWGLSAKRRASSCVILFAWKSTRRAWSSVCSPSWTPSSMA